MRRQTEEKMTWLVRAWRTSGVVAVVREQFQLDPLSGHWFLFRNRRGDRVNSR